jgi:hypothetical protein
MSLKNLKELCKCYYPLSVLAMSWILMTNCVWHDLLLLKPCWLSCYMLFCLIWVLILLVKMCSKTLQQIAVKDTCNFKITSFFLFVIKRTIYRLSIISLAHAPVHVTDFPVVNVHVDELSSVRIWQHKLCAILSANVNIN